MRSCPSDETLARLGDDSLDDAEWVALEAHVQSCALCADSLEKLVAHETLTAPPTSALPAEEDLPHIPGFAIEGELGRGGMGVVYRAWETKLARTVALKIVPSGPMTGARERRRWLAEARCITQVCHPHIVQIHDAGEADGWLYLVLEFLPGGSLKERLRGPVPPRGAVEFMKPVATAMGAVHTAGLLHLDLKPSNILLDSARDATWREASPKVADFGIARPLADLDASSTSLAVPWGTPCYMAPEQITADRRVLGPATDVYALGAILYELLTGRAPFQGTSTLETLDQVRDQDPVPPKRLNPKVPRDLETIALKCLEKNPSRRYRSAEDLADDLNRFLEGRPIKARPVSAIERAARWCRRQPVIAALAATLFLTMIGSFLGLLALLRRSEAERLRSEANYQVAARSLDGIVGVLVDQLRDDPVRYHRFNDKKTLEIVHEQQVELSKRYPLDIGGVKRLASIGVCLAILYEHDGKVDAARSLLQESIGRCEAYLAVNPADADLQHRFFQLAVLMVSSLACSENDRLYEQCDARAIALLERWKLAPNVHAAHVAQLSTCHRHRAEYLIRRGKSDRAWKVLERDFAHLRSMPAAERAFRESVLTEARTLSALAEGSDELTPRGSPIHPRSAIVGFSHIDLYIGEIAARRAGWLPSTVKPDGRIPEDPSCERWTDCVISSIQADAAKFAVHHTRLPEICRFMLQFGAPKLAWQRQHGQLGDARRSVDRLLTLANRLVQSYPDQTDTYLLLSEGYLQRAKIAYRVPDEPVIGWELKSLDAALHAMTLEPNSHEAHGLVKDRRARLDKLASK